jgi:predicted MFS family arabinose efflux permease
MRRGINLVAAAFALTALSYGLARFAYGLLLPQIRKDLSFDLAYAGWIGGSAFAAYCGGIVLTFVCSGRLNPRTMALSASVAATVGMGLIALASSGWMLGLGMVLAGLSTGLTSPPLASAVAAHFSDAGRTKANAIINAGTAAGIVFSGIASLMGSGAWRELYALFALLGSLVTAWLWFALPPSTNRGLAKGFSIKRLKRPGLFALCSSACLMGLASTAVWTFGADLLRAESGFTDTYVAGAWIALGVAGLSGVLTGRLTKRFGTANVHGFSLLAMAAGTLGLATAALSPFCGIAAMGLFGAAYIVSSGAYLIQGIDLFPDRPDLGLGMPFLMLALGQTTGAPLFGAALAVAGRVGALSAFAALTCLAIVVRPRR